MHIISSTILFMLVLNSLCKGKENEDWTIIFTPAEVTAVSGLCALISCTFTYPDGAKPIATVQWRNKGTLIYNKITNYGEERIKMVEPDLDQKNCSIIIKDITAEDKGKYTFRVEGPSPHRNTYKDAIKIIIKDKPEIKVPLLRDGQQANLSCSAPFPCPESPPEITWWMKKTGEDLSELKENITLTSSTSFYLSTLTFMPNTELHNATVGCEVSYGHRYISDSRTIFVHSLRIVGNDTVNEGDTLSLSCTVDSHPPSSKPVWSFNGSTDELRNHMSEETLTITNVSRRHAEEYVCEVTYMNDILNTSIHINVMRPKGSDSAKADQENVDMNMIKNDNNTLNIPTNTTAAEDFLRGLKLSTILTFLAGMAASAVLFLMLLCCWLCYNRAKKHKGEAAPQDTAVNLETLQTNVDLTATSEQSPLYNQCDGAISNTQVESTGEAEESKVAEAEAGEVDYAAIDYSLLKKKQDEEVERQSVDTEYAEISRDGRRREALQNEMSDGGTEEQNQKKDEEEIYCNSQAFKG